MINQLFVDSIGGTIANVLASSAVDIRIDPRSGQTKNYKISICCFCARHRTLSGQSKDWFVLNQDNVSEWNSMYTCGLLLQCASTIKIRLSVLV